GRLGSVIPSKLPERPIQAAEEPTPDRPQLVALSRQAGRSASASRLLALPFDHLRRTAMPVIASTSRALALAPRLGAALALLLLMACDDLPTERRGDVAFQNVAKATLPRSGPQVRTVVYDQASWQVVWRELWGNSAPPRPEIDFRREMVVVATASLSCFGDIAIE